MKIALYMILLLTAPLLAALSVWFQKSYIDEKKPTLKEALSAHKKLFVLISVLQAGLALFLLLVQENKELRNDLLIQNALLWDGVLCVTVTDIRVKKIPNAVTGLLFLLRLVFLAWGMIFEGDGWKGTAKDSLFGMLFGGGFILVCMLLSKGGIGAGDLKIFAVLGLYFGFFGLVPIMIYSLFLSAIWSIGLLISHKGKLKSTLPMAPFILIGLTIYYILL